MPINTVLKRYNGNTWEPIYMKTSANMVEYKGASVENALATMVSFSDELCPDGDAFVQRYQFAGTGSSTVNTPGTDFGSLINIGVANGAFSQLLFDRHGLAYIRGYSGWLPEGSRFTQWEKFSLAKSPSKIQLPIESGFTSAVYDSYFVKTQENLVHVSFCIKKTDGEIQVGDVVATLPIGYRPTVNVARIVGTDAVLVGGGYSSAEVQVRPNGEIYLFGISSKTNWLYGEISFLAEG